MKKAAIMFAGLALLVLTACQSGSKAPVSPPITFSEAAASEFIKTNRDAVDALVAGLDPEEFSPILVATIVDVNDLHQAKPLGRTLSEQYVSRLVSLGFSLKAVNLRGDVFVSETTGELLLSRNVDDIAQVYSASVVLVGTYSMAGRLTFVSLKLVNAMTGQIIRTHDYALPNNSDVRALLR